MRRRPFLDQRRPSFKRRWQQRPWWVRLALSLLLALACVLLLAVLLGSPDPGASPSTSAASSGSETTSSPLLRQVSTSHFSHLVDRFVIWPFDYGHANFSQ
jgi:alpha-1,4-galacturonosyltransferase